MEIKVLYGSETGNSEEISKRIANLINNNGFKASFASLNTFSKELDKLCLCNKKKLIVVVCSTTGNGDPPRSSEAFVRYIKNKKFDSSHMESFEFALLGLGDSNYSKFQAIPKLIESNLLRLGAKSFINKGQADDAYGLEETVEPWVESLINKILKEYKLRFESNSTEEVDQKTNNINNSKFKKLVKSEYIPFTTNFNYELKSKKRISGVFAQKEIYSMTFSSVSSTQEVIYQPGSNVSILPEINSDKFTFLNEFLVLNDLSNISTDDLYFIPTFIVESNPHLQTHLSSNSNYMSKEDIIKYLFDFTSIIKKSNLIKLKELALNKITNDKLKSLLIQLITILEENFNLNVIKNKISFYDILFKLHSHDKSLKFAIDIFDSFELFNIKLPRKYSISTDYTYDVNPGIVYTVVKQSAYRTSNKSIFFSKNENYTYYGEATNYLKNMKEKDKFLITGFSNDFPFNKEEHMLNNKPLIYVSNGTGITPMLSYIKNISRENTDKMGKINIITGFRSNDINTNESIEEEFIIKYANETNKINKEKDTFSLSPLPVEEQNKINYFACYSQNEDNEDEECGYWRNVRINYDYVQDIIIDKKDIVYRQLFEEKGTMMICGDIDKLYDEILSILISMLKSKQNIQREEAIYLIDQVKVQGRLLVEKWS